LVVVLCAVQALAALHPTLQRAKSAPQLQTAPKKCEYPGGYQSGVFQLVGYHGTKSPVSSFLSGFDADAPMANAQQFGKGFYVCPEATYAAAQQVGGQTSWDITGANCAKMFGSRILPIGANGLAASDYVGATSKTVGAQRKTYPEIKVKTSAFSKISIMWDMIKSREPGVRFGVGKMSVTIKGLAADKTLPVECSDPVSYVTAALQGDAAPKIIASIAFAGKPLSAATTLFAARVQDGDTLTVTLEDPEPEMTISYVLATKAKQGSVSVGRSATVQDFLQAVEDREGKLTSPRLRFGSKELKEMDKTLESLGVTEGGAKIMIVEMIRY